MTRSSELSTTAAPAAAAPHTSPVAVVVGPKTRLGAQLLDRMQSHAEDVIALARDERDVQALAGRRHVIASDAGDDTVRSALGAGPVRIHVCALGPVHPDEPVDAMTVERELGVIDRLVRAAVGRDVRVVLISSVITLAPGADRRYYAGWKALVEQRLQDLVDRRPGASLSVLYPGRLVAGRDARRPWQFAYTTYDRLATLAMSAAARPARSRIVGADARVWLALRAVALGLISITGRSRSGRHLSAARDGVEDTS